MDNLFDIFRRAPSESQLAYLIAHIMTNGVYKSNVTVDPFDFKVYDVGGTRAGRKKWGHCLGENLDFIIHVVDLNGYCQHLQEDHDTVSQAFREQNSR